MIKVYHKDDVYINGQFEIDIMDCFLQTISLVDEDYDIEKRKLQFSFYLSDKNRELSSIYREEIESFNIDWSSYDGNVFLYYRPFLKTTYTEVHFFVKEILDILN